MDTDLIIELSSEILKKQDDQFYIRLSRVKKSKDKNKKASEIDLNKIRDVLKTVLLQETGFKIYPLLEPTYPSYSRSDLEELPIDDAYQKITTPHLILENLEIRENEKLLAIAMPEIGINSPEFQCCSLYHAIELNRLNSESQIITQREAIDQFNLELESITGKLTEIEKDFQNKSENLRRKKNLPYNKRKSTESLESEILVMQEKLTAKESQKTQMECKINDSKKKIVEYAARLEAGTVTYLYQLKEYAKKAGLENLMQKAETCAKSREEQVMGRIKNRINGSFELENDVAKAMINKYRDPNNNTNLVSFIKKYKNLSFFKFNYKIQPEEKKGYGAMLKSLPKWKKMVGVGVMVAMGAMLVKEYKSMNSKTNYSKQVVVDYQLFKERSMSLNELGKKYKPDTLEYKYLIKKMIEDNVPLK